ncbi:MAG: EamA family transporter [Proteobacteria bacterium]|nr:MAG: EamA family transporter [Pseudomonadota bacterium]
MGFVFAIGAALGFSAKAIFVKLAYTYNVDTITLLMFRMMFALPFFLIIAYLEERKEKRRISHKNMALIILMGLIGYYLSSLLDFMGLVYISAGLERLILFIYPTMVVILSSFFFGKKIQKEAYIALALSYAGIALAMFNDIQIATEHVLLGSALVFASTLSYSIFLVGSGELIPKVGARRFAAYAMIVSCIAVFIHFALVRDMSAFEQPLEVYGYGLAMAVFSTVIPAFLLAAAIQHIGASKTSIIGGLGPIATIVMATVFLNEAISTAQILGAALVMTGIFILGKKR